jgi:hypothetical protein
MCVDVHVHVHARGGKGNKQARESAERKEKALKQTSQRRKSNSQPEAVRGRDTHLTHTLCFPAFVFFVGWDDWLVLFLFSSFSLAFPGCLCMFFQFLLPSHRREQL